MNIYLNFCNYILLMCNQYILNQILLEELKAAKIISLDMRQKLLQVIRETSILNPVLNPVNPVLMIHMRHNPVQEIKETLIVNPVLVNNILN